MITSGEHTELIVLRQRKRHWLSGNSEVKEARGLKLERARYVLKNMNMAEDLILRKGGVTVRLVFTGDIDEIKELEREILEALNVTLTVDSNYLKDETEEASK